MYTNMHCVCVFTGTRVRRLRPWSRHTHGTQNYLFWRGVVAGAGLRTEADPPLANSALPTKDYFSLDVAGKPTKPRSRKSHHWRLPAWLKDRGFEFGSVIKSHSKTIVRPPSRSTNDEPWRKWCAIRGRRVAKRRLQNGDRRNGVCQNGDWQNGDRQYKGRQKDVCRSRVLGLRARPRQRTNLGPVCRPFRRPNDGNTTRRPRTTASARSSISRPSKATLERSSRLRGRWLTRSVRPPSLSTKRGSPKRRSPYVCR